MCTALMVLDEKPAKTDCGRAICSMYLTTGLEFRPVGAMGGDDVLPPHERIEAATEQGELDEVYATERHLLYVACTRARDYLLVTGVDPVSEFLGDMRS